jgi:hypothetical protein
MPHKCATLRAFVTFWRRGKYYFEFLKYFDSIEGKYEQCLALLTVVGNRREIENCWNGRRRWSGNPRKGFIQDNEG